MGCLSWRQSLRGEVDEAIVVAKLHVILISSVRPAQTLSGHLPLYRHLVEDPEIALDVYGGPPPLRGLQSLLYRIVGRLIRSSRWRESAWHLWGGRWLDSFLPGPEDRDHPAVVMTVAHGDGYVAAMRFAERHGLPLVSFFHDWWPDLASPLPMFVRSMADRFSELYQRSAVAFCVSHGMKEMLGEHAGAEVLYPIPGDPASLRQRSWQPSRGMRLLYFGNLRDYGDLVRGALEMFVEHSRIRLEVRGEGYAWERDVEERMKQAGCLLGFVPEDDFRDWLETGDAYLVTLSFDPALRRRMKTSFPSKLLEAAQYGRPIIIWGPEDSAAVRWARQGEADKALCVMDPGPQALRAAVEELAADPNEQGRLGEEAQRAALNEFSPLRLHEQFKHALGRVGRPS